MAIRINLKTGIPKARKVLGELVPGKCDYTAPCVIGAMVSPATRRRMEFNGLDDTTIKSLIDDDLVKVPASQVEDFIKLQFAFDTGNDELFRETFENVARRYEAPRDSGSDRQAKTPQAAEGEASQSGLSDSEGIAR